ncbi:MAG: DUF4230 domain-containing protein [Lachnospiraceae bacterium]|nr:DUF4230 domain-containing protein [Lachnospiraceae bacterium]
MKRILTIIFMMITVIATTSCGKEKTVEPQVSQMKAICDLATMDCYYHNVAKLKEEDAEGFLFWKKDKHFWIEYSGIVTIGIDVSKVNIEVKEDTVSITMPPAKVLDCKVDETSLSEDSFIVAQKSASVKAEDQTKAYEAAQSNMEKAAEEDSVLLANAQQRAQKLLEDYVNNIGNSVGKEYEINWIYLDENSNDVDSAELESEE